jgi:hypothetical protein
MNTKINNSNTFIGPILVRFDVYYQGQAYKLSDSAEYQIVSTVGIPRYARDFRKRLVEAVGVEPTSENVTGQEPTYLVQFTRRELPRQIRVLRLERTRNAKR